MNWLIDHLRQALEMAAGMFSQTAWSLVLGFTIWSLLQAIVPADQMRRALGKDGVREIAMVFEGATSEETVRFIATAEALAYLVDPNRPHIDPRTCKEVFAKHELDIRAVARKLYWRLGGDKQPITLRREDMPALI